MTTKDRSLKRLARRLAPLACVALLGVTAAACGSDTKQPADTTPSGSTTPATTAPKAGGTGF